MTTPADALYEWATDTLFTNGPGAGTEPTKVTPTSGEIAEGLVGGQSVKVQHANACFDNFRRWIEHSMDRVENLGDGTDGDVTISSGTTTLARDMHYNSLTVSGTGTLDTAGYRVMSRTTVTISTGGTISVQPAGAGSIAGGIAGSAGGSTGNPGLAGSGVDAIGGDSGAGGTGAGGAGGGAGSAYGNPIHDRLWVARHAVNGIVSLPGGSGGGGGGGGDSGSGGAGGRGGGNVYIACKDLVWAGGAIEAIGEDGSPAAGSSNGGGGGGGGGGHVFLRRRTETGTPSIDVSGGAGGAGDGTGSAGSAGSAGVTTREDI